MKRRDFLAYGAASLAVVTLGRSTRWFGGEARAAGPPPGDVIAEFDYKGHHVQIVKDATRGVLMYLDGAPLSPHAFAKSSKGYASHLLPFSDPASPITMAKALIDGDGTLFILRRPATARSAAAPSSKAGSFLCRPALSAP